MQNKVIIYPTVEASDEKFSKTKTIRSIKNQTNDANDHIKPSTNKRKILYISISIVFALLIIFLIVYFVKIKKRKKTVIEPKNTENNNFIIAKYSFTKGKETTLFHPEIINIDESEYQIEIISPNNSDQKRGLLQNKNNYLYTPSFDGNALVKIIFNKTLESIDSLFQSCEDLLYIDFSNFNSSEITSMSSTFLGDINLEKVNFTSFNSSKVEIMDFLFADCEKLLEVNTEFLNTKNVQTMSGMFVGCKKLRTVNLTNFDLSNIKNVGGMFADCPSLKALDLTSFSNIDYMFDDLENNNGIIIKIDKNKIDVTVINEKYNNKITIVAEITGGAIEVSCEMGEGESCKTCAIDKTFYCKECNDGYYLSISETYSKMKCYKCNEGCSECSMDDNEILKCTNCEENYKLFEGNCIKNCEIGENDSCASCNFAEGKNAECLTCNNGYYLDTNTKNKCKKIEIELCTKATISSGNVICTECENGYGVKNNECVEICVTGEKEKCASCDPSFEDYTSCLTCNKGYYLPLGDNVSKSFCLPCSENCDQCDGSSVYSTCNKCKDGYYIYESEYWDDDDNLYFVNVCGKCPVDHCVECTGDNFYGYNFCMNCEKGYVASSGVCIKPCDKNEKATSCNCPNYDTVNDCVTCKKGYISSDQILFENHDYNNLYYTDETLKICTIYDYLRDCTFYYNGKCYSCLYDPKKGITQENYDDFFVRQNFCIEEKCTKGVNEKCSTCEIKNNVSSSKCSKCNFGYYLPTDADDQTKCELCEIQNCEKCEGTLDNKVCTKCVNNFLAYNGVCVKDCEIGAYELCKSCNLNEGKYGECLECNFGYYLPTDSKDKSTCKKVEQLIDYCEEYIGNLTNYFCNKCRYGYILFNNKCIKNCATGQNEKCSTCNFDEEGKNNQCSKCNIGYYLPSDDNEKTNCSSCPSHCNMCYGSFDNITCTKCGNNYVVAEGECIKQCEVGNENNCAVCDKVEKQKCSKCLPGYYMPSNSDGITCQKCSLSDCEICEGTIESNVCKQCFFNFYPTVNNNNVIECQTACEKGDEGRCLTCSEKVKGECASCNEDYKLIDGKCISLYSVVAEYNIKDTTKKTLLIFYNYIEKMKINGKIVDPSNKYKFEKTGKVTVEMKLKSNFLIGNRLFYQVTELTSIKFLQTFEAKMKFMGNMFNGCVNLETADLSGLDLSNGGNVEYFFRYCDNLKTVIFYNSTTNLMKATNFEYMFGECHSLTSIDLSSFNVNSAKYIHHMFYDTPKLTYIDLSTFTKQAKHDDGMFEKTSENGKIKINEQIPQTIKSQIPSSWTIIY